MEWCRLCELVDLLCNHMKRPMGPQTFILSHLAFKPWRIFRVLVRGMKHVHNWQCKGLSCSYCMLPTKTVPQPLMGFAGGEQQTSENNCACHTMIIQTATSRFNKSTRSTPCSHAPFQHWSACIRRRVTSNSVRVLILIESNLADSDLASKCNS